MSRIRKAYESQFRSLLLRARARRVEKGMDWLIHQAHLLSKSEQILPGEALARVYHRVAARKPFARVNAAVAPELFFCDAGLGALARWLRAAGYDAHWEPDIDDDDLLRKARQTGATILTTDSMLMERRVLRIGTIPAFWLPPTLYIPDQLKLVFDEFGLKPRASRCMNCGGQLIAVDKNTLRNRIPPRTYRWLDEYFLCERCNHLFWHGTHWGHIRTALHRITRGPTDPV
jgi:uncharacterized protein with PIN domain